MIAQINITPFDAATFADSKFVLVSVLPESGHEYKYDWKDYTILIDDVSEIRRNRDDNECIVFLESGLYHRIEFNEDVVIDVNGETPSTNEELRDLLMAAVKAPKYTPPTP